MTTNKIFSVPLNPKLTENQYSNFIEFLKTHKDYIYDVYFTCRMPPFLQDAMGDVFRSNDDHYTVIDQALHLSKETDISLSATFNNTLVRPTQQNLDLWISNFEQLYATGAISSVTIPHTHWVATRIIQNKFPDLDYYYKRNLFGRYLVVKKNETVGVSLQKMDSGRRLTENSFRAGRT